MEVEEDRPAAGRPDQGGDHPLDPVSVEHGPGDGVLGIQRPGQQVVLLGSEAGGHGLGDGDERHGVRDLEDREPLPVGGGDQGLGRPGEVEAEAEPQAGQAGPGETLDVGPLLGRALAHPDARGQQQLAPLQKGRRVGELGAVDPADGAAGPRFAGHQAQVELGDAEQVADGQRHRRIVRFVQPGPKVGFHLAHRGVPRAPSAPRRSGLTTGGTVDGAYKAPSVLLPRRA